MFVYLQYIDFFPFTFYMIINDLITDISHQYYTVVKNVKRTHQLQESGEFQEFNDDVEYFLDALR